MDGHYHNIKPVMVMTYTVEDEDDLPTECCHGHKTQQQPRTSWHALLTTIGSGSVVCK